MNDLTISIINYKTKDLTAKCLDSILKKKWDIKYEIYLVDNGSEDGSVEFFEKKYPKVKLIDAKKNLGFAAGHNLVLKKVESPYVLILNSDTEILENTLDEMISFMKDNKEIGIASCKVLNVDGSLQPNAGDLPFGFALINWLFNLESLGIKNSFHRNEKQFYETKHEVGWVSGSFMMIRKTVFEKIGYFNEKFFMYMEDVELCKRVKDSGFKIFLNPTVTVKHSSGGSSQNPQLRQWLGEYRGLIILYQLTFGEMAAAGIRVMIYVSSILRLIAFQLIGKGETSNKYAKVIRSL